MSIIEEIVLKPNKIGIQTADIAIIGGGLSGLQLLNAFMAEPALADQQIVIIEAEAKPIEKTWCFWETGKGQWDVLCFHQWEKGNFIDQEGELDLQIAPYHYKMVRSIDFIAHFKEIIENNPNISWINKKVSSVDSKARSIIAEDLEIKAKLIFDSRWNPKELEQSKEPTVLQHFKGFFVKSEKPIFNPAEFTMMDFRHPYKDLCSFTYVLPFSENEALVEYTFFSPTTLAESIYDDLLQQYLSSHYPNVNFKIESEEMGVIPMSTYNFQKFNRDGYYRIGTAGGWVKASSGYSFKHAEKKSKIIAQNLANGFYADQNLFKKRFKFYDRIFLRVLQDQNNLGNQLFQAMYRKNSSEEIFRFLDEESNLLEEIRLINKFQKDPFLKALRKEYFF